MSVIWKKDFDAQFYIDKVNELRRMKSDGKIEFTDAFAFRDS